VHKIGKRIAERIIGGVTKTRPQNAQKVAQAVTGKLGNKNLKMAALVASLGAGIATGKAISNKSSGDRRR